MLNEILGRKGWNVHSPKFIFFLRLTDLKAIISLSRWKQGRTRLKRYSRAPFLPSKSLASAKTKLLEVTYFPGWSSARATWPVVCRSVSRVGVRRHILEIALVWESYLKGSLNFFSKTLSLNYKDVLLFFFNNHNSFNHDPAQRVKSSKPFTSRFPLSGHPSGPLSKPTKTAVAAWSLIWLEVWPFIV